MKNTLAYASDKQVNLGSDEYTDASLVWNQLTTYLKMFWSTWYLGISFSRILWMRPVLYPAKNEEIYGIVS